MWIRLCVFKEELVEKVLLQNSQEYGLSPVWVLTCLSSREGRSNILPQWGQGIVFLLNLATLFASLLAFLGLGVVGVSSSLLELLSPPEEREWDGEGKKVGRGGLLERRLGKGELGGDTEVEVEDRSNGDSWGSLGQGLTSRHCLWRRAALMRRAW